MNDNAGWHPDPSGRHEQRYYDGERWTDHVADQGRTGVDPIMPPPPSSLAVSALAEPVTLQPDEVDKLAPKPSRKNLWWIFGGIAAVVVVVGLIAALTGGDDDGEQTGASDDPGVEVSTTTVADGGPSTTEAAATTSTSTTAAPATGTRTNPHSIGTVDTVGDWEVAVIGFTPNANEAVRAENQFNPEPAEGRVWTLVRVRATYTGEGTDNAYWGLSVSYVGADNRVYTTSTGQSAVEPDPLSGQPEVLAGGTVEGNVLLELPTDVVGTGAVGVGASFSLDEDTKWWAEQ